LRFDVGFGFTGTTAGNGTEVPHDG
jgi:hypothetical protein